MQRLVWLNGSLLDPDQARVSAFDAGITHGVGLFETMTAIGTDTEPDGRIFQLAEHLSRLEHSARQLNLVSTLNTRALAEAAELAVKQSGICAVGSHHARARVRLTLTGGDLNLLQQARRDRSAAGAHEAQDGPPDHAGPTVIIDVTQAQEYPEDMFANGISVVIGNAKANPLNPFEGHKALNYWWRLAELQQAAAKHAGEAVILQVTNHLAGGSVSNIVLIKDGRAHTPIAQGEEQQGAVPSPVLPGTTRAWALEHLAASRIATSKRMLTVDDLLDADEVLLTNASWGVLPVTRVEAKPIGAGRPGPVTAQLIDAWRAALESDV